MSEYDTAYTKNKTQRPSDLSLSKAAQAWCAPSTQNTTMDSDLAIEFARILDEIRSKPWLGNATTRELLEELSTRSDLDYKTTGEDTDKLLEEIQLNEVGRKVQIR